MALYKSTRQNDGIVTNYHRILYLISTTNRQNSIAVLSYFDAESREYEQNNPDSSVYVKSVTYETDYDDSMTMEDAYEYLKTLPEFEGAEDV